MSDQSTITSVKGRTFTISRAKWLRGIGAMDSRLLRPEIGDMCCLGQIALQCGYAPADILDKSTPKSIDWIELLKGNPLFPKTLTTTDPVSSMMCANDTEHTSDKYKEKRLKELAVAAGFALEFVP